MVSRLTSFLASRSTLLVSFSKFERIFGSMWIRGAPIFQRSLIVLVLPRSDAGHRQQTCVLRMRAQVLCQQAQRLVRPPVIDQTLRFGHARSARDANRRRKAGGAAGPFAASVEEGAVEVVGISDRIRRSLDHVQAVDRGGGKVTRPCFCRRARREHRFTGDREVESLITRRRIAGTGDSGEQPERSGVPSFFTRISERQQKQERGCRGLGP